MCLGNAKNKVLHSTLSGSCFLLAKKKGKEITNGEEHSNAIWEMPFLLIDIFPLSKMFKLLRQEDGPAVILNLYHMSKTSS